MDVSTCLLLQQLLSCCNYCSRAATAAGAADAWFLMITGPRRHTQSTWNACQVVLTAKRVKELQTWVAFHQKHESLDTPVDVRTTLPLDCSTIEHVRIYVSEVRDERDPKQTIGFPQGHALGDRTFAGTFGVWNNPPYPEKCVF